MPCSRFAARFVQVVGLAAMAYLPLWLIGAGKGLLRCGQAVDQVAVAAGYARARPCGRAFTGAVGQPPVRWLRAIGA
jgi:methylphosphotriester-DNA--protein-cysteine methyltransferase